MEDTLLRALDRAAADLNQAAADLDAQSTAVLVNADQGVEVPASALRFSILQRNNDDALFHAEGPIDATSPLAPLLREAVSPNAQSFLLQPWPLNRRAVTAVFGFAAATPPVPRLSESALESLNRVCLTIWSALEITRLNAELRAANERLAGRKLVERAKGFLQLKRGLTEEMAYQYLRGQSRKRRIKLTKLAEEVVQGQGS